MLYRPATVRCVAIRTERRESSTARVPRVTAGTAITVTRYSEEKAVILHPDDFHRLVALDAALDEVAQAPGMSDLVLQAHRLEDQPGRPLEDPIAIRALLGL